MSEAVQYPKPTPPKGVALVTKVEPLTTFEKSKFVRKPHLTEKPFRQHEGLQLLQKQMETQPRQSPNQKENK